MSDRKEKEPLSHITENEEIELTNKDVENNRRDKKNSSVKSTGENQISPLIRAVRHGSSSTSFYFQETDLNNCDLKETDNFQRNVFHYAVSKPDTLRKILKHFETKPSAKQALYLADKLGETPIHRAAAIANIESMQILHEYDNSLIKINTTIGRRSLLHMAVKSRSVVAVQFVLSKAPELVDSVDNMLQTPVHYAAGLKQSSIIELLIAKGCNTTVRDANDKLPIHIAACKGLYHCIELLLHEDPDVIDAVDNSEHSPLLLAAKNGFSHVVSYLLAKNADYELNDKDGLTAFDWAVCREFPDVVQAFLDTNMWRKLVSTSRYGPEGCLTLLVESMPEMAKKLLDKCITTKGTKDHPDYQVTYDFFCLESKDEKSSGPQFAALELVVENVSEIILRHPVAVKYVDLKWKKRGFKYTMAVILLTLVFHICLMLYTTRVIGVVNRRTEIRQSGGRNITQNIRKRYGRPPNASEMMALRVIMLIIVCGGILKEVIQITAQRLYYFTMSRHYYRLALCICVMFFLLPANQTLTPRQIGWGAVTVLLSWINLMQFLKLVPVLGTYLILVQKVFWTLIKIFIVVLIYLLSFASTFYVLLAEHDSFRNIYISFVTTFVAMISGIEYDDLFVTVGWYPQIYELKMVLLVLFMLIMAIVVNNALIGLAVGDAAEVMKSASFDKFVRKAKFVIDLERVVNHFDFMKYVGDEVLVEFPGHKKNICEQVLDLLYFGSKIDAVDANTEENDDEHEMKLTLEDHIERAVENKLEKFRSSLRRDLKGIQDQIKEDREILEDKMKAILEKLE